MVNIETLLIALFSSAGTFSLIQFIISRHDRKKDNLSSLKKDLERIEKLQNDTNLRVTRMELMNLINRDSNNLDAILQVAEYYFVELDGNAYAHAIFEKWAIEHDVAVGWLPKITKGVKNGTNTTS